MGASAWMVSRTWRRSGLRTNLPHSGQPSTPHVGLGSEGLHPQHAQQARTCMSSLTMVDYLLLTRVLLGPAILPALWSHLPGAEGTWLGGFHSGESRSTGGAQKQGDSALISGGLGPAGSAGHPQDPSGVDVILWTGASVDLADDLLLWSGQALFLEHQRVDSGSQRPPSVSWTLDHWDPSPLQPLCT